MAINTIRCRLDLWEGLKNGIFFIPFRKKTIFNENLPPEDSITSKI